MKNESDKTPDRLGIELDYEKYAHFLGSVDWTEDQKRDYAQMIWNIVVDFVSLGFGVHPVQQAKAGSNLKVNKRTDAVSFVQEMVELDDSDLKDKYRIAAGLEPGKAEKGVGT